jgi:hypothetical protein
MESDDRFTQWAAHFITAYNKNNQQVEQVYSGITQAASELLQSIDAGGVPAFVTSSLIEIANENDIAVPDHWTPNEIVAAIRIKAVSTPELSDAYDKIEN